MEKLISVVLPAFNAERYIAKALESIQQQTHHNLEIIVIDDGSTDGTLSLVREMASSDERIRVFSRENRGLINTLNEGINLASGSFIARMDADDLSHPDRFRKQLEFLESKNLDICGCHYFTVDAEDRVLDAVVVPTSYDDILLKLCTSVPFAHGSILARKSIFDVFKYQAHPPCAVEDYELWTRMFATGIKFGNVDEFLFRYRIFADSYSEKKRKQMTKDLAIVRKKHCRNYNVEIKEALRQRSQSPVLSDQDQRELLSTALAVRSSLLPIFRKSTLKNKIIGVHNFLKN